jgi:hypothetical protein
MGGRQQQTWKEAAPKSFETALSILANGQLNYMAGEQ